MTRTPVGGDSIAVSPASPRAAVTAFLEAARRGDLVGATRYLDLPPSQVSDGATSARRLKLVLDHYVWLDLADIAANAAGDTTDGLPAGIDQIATIQIGNVGPKPVRLSRNVVRTESGADTVWRFSRATAERIPEWYESIGNRWLIGRLPAPLLRSGPLDFLWWQWVAILPLLGVAAGIGVVGSRLLRAGLTLVARRTATEWDDVVLTRLGAPLTVFCMLTAAVALVPLLDLYVPAAAIALRWAHIGYAIVVFWSLWRLVDVGRQLLAQTHWAATLPASRSLVPLGARLAKVVVAALALIAVLSTLGYPVASLIAGLGIGGLALALAAQKTVENLFGAFSIGIDQPFREGDFVKVDDFVGTVEAIGLRSTRFRTLDRTIVSLPNGRLADMRLESFTARDRLRFAAVIGLVYETTAAQMRVVLEGFERALSTHPKIWPDAVVVRFSELASSSLNIEVMAWFQTSDWGEFQRIRQDVLLEFMDVVEAAGSSFAFPTTTVHLAGTGDRNT